MPQLNPEVGVPTVELVSPETSREELIEIYQEVYRLHRLPGSPPGQPAVTEEVLATIPDCLNRGKEAPKDQALPGPEDSRPSNSGRPHLERDSLVDRSLARMWEVHQKALSVAAALEGEIERLSNMRACPRSRVRSRSWDHWRSREGQKKRRCQVSFVDESAPGQSASPEMPSDKEELEGDEANLEDPPELKPTVASFLQGLPETSGDKGNKVPLEPAVLDLAGWVMWKAKMCDTPDWWRELSAVPGEEDTRKLARQVWASFQIPHWLQELNEEMATLRAPPAPPCLCRQKFMPPPKSIFTSQDIREVPREKTVAYARALQYWAEQNNLPTGGESHLLAEGVQEVREETKWYLTFTNEEVFHEVAVLEVEEEGVSATPSPANAPQTTLMPKPRSQERSPQFIGWKKVLHPSQLVVAAGEMLQPTQTSK